MGHVFGGLRSPSMASLDTMAGTLSLRDVAPCSVPLFRLFVRLFRWDSTAVSLICTVQGDGCHYLHALLTGHWGAIQRWFLGIFSTMVLEFTFTFTFSGVFPLERVWYKTVSLTMRGRYR